MIVFKIKLQMDLKAARESRKITLAVVASETDIALSSLKKMSGRTPYNASLNVVESLCRYFQCQPGDLIEYVEALDTG